MSAASTRSPASAAGTPRVIRPKPTLAVDAHPGEQAALLEHHGVLHRPAGGIDVDGAARLAVEAGEDAQQRRFPAAARPDDAEEFARAPRCRSMSVERDARVLRR